MAKGALLTEQGGPSIGFGEGLQAKVDSPLPQMEQIAAQKEERLAAAKRADQERQKKIKDLELDEFIKGVEPDYNKLAPVYYKNARDAAQDFILDAFKLYNETGSPQEFLAKLSGNANMVKEKFSGFYTSSDQINKLINTPTEKLTPTGLAFRSAAEAANAKGDINDLNDMWAQIPDEKKEFTFTPYNPDIPGSGQVRVNKMLSGQDIDAYAKTEASDLPQLMGSNAGVVNVLNKYYKRINYEPFISSQAAQAYATAHGLEATPASIESKSQDMVSNPKYSGAINDYYLMHYGSGDQYDVPGSRNKDGSLNNDQSLIGQGAQKYFMRKLNDNRPKPITKDYEGTVEEQKEWQYKLAHPEEFQNNVYQVNTQPYQEKLPYYNGNNSATVSGYMSYKPTKVVSGDHPAINMETGKTETVNLGNGAITGDTKIKAYIINTNGEFSPATDEQVAKNPGKIVRIPVTVVQVPKKGTDITRDAAGQAVFYGQNVQYDNYEIPTTYIANQLLQGATKANQGNTIQSLQQLQAQADKDNQGVNPELKKYSTQYGVYINQQPEQPTEDDFSQFKRKQ